MLSLSLLASRPPYTLPLPRGGTSSPLSLSSTGRSCQLLLWLCFHIARLLLEVLLSWPLLLLLCSRPAWSKCAWPGRRLSHPAPNNVPVRAGQQRQHRHAQLSHAHVQHVNCTVAGKTVYCCKHNCSLYSCRHTEVVQSEAGAPVLLLMTAARSRCGLEAAEQLEPGLGWSLCSSARATSVVLLSSTYLSRRGSTANARASAPAGKRHTTRGEAAGRWSQGRKGTDSDHTHRKLADLSYVL